MWYNLFCCFQMAALSFKGSKEYEFLNRKILTREGFVGIIRYIGKYSAHKGLWCGIEFEEPHGEHDGMVDGVRYFSCKPKCGILLPLTNITRSKSEGSVQLLPQSPRIRYRSNIEGYSNEYVDIKFEPTFISNDVGNFPIHTKKVSYKNTSQCIEKPLTAEPRFESEESLGILSDILSGSDIDELNDSWESFDLCLDKENRILLKDKSHLQSAERNYYQEISSVQAGTKYTCTSKFLNNSPLDSTITLQQDDDVFVLNNSFESKEGKITSYIKGDENLNSTFSVIQVNPSLSLSNIIDEKKAEENPQSKVLSIIRENSFENCDYKYKTFNMDLNVTFDVKNYTLTNFSTMENKKELKNDVVSTPLVKVTSADNTKQSDSFFINCSPIEKSSPVLAKLGDNFDEDVLTSTLSIRSAAKLIESDKNIDLNETFKLHVSKKQNMEDNLNDPVIKKNKKSNVQLDATFDLDFVKVNQNDKIQCVSSSSENVQAELFCKTNQKSAVEVDHYNFKEYSSKFPNINKGELHDKYISSGIEKKNRLSVNLKQTQIASKNTGKSHTLSSSTCVNTNKLILKDSSSKFDSSVKPVEKFSSNSNSSALPFLGSTKNFSSKKDKLQSTEISKECSMSKRNYSKSSILTKPFSSKVCLKKPVSNNLNITMKPIDLIQQSTINLNITKNKKSSLKFNPHIQFNKNPDQEVGDKLKIYSRLKLLGEKNKISNINVNMKDEKMEAEKESCNNTKKLNVSSATKYCNNKKAKTCSRRHTINPSKELRNFSKQINQTFSGKKALDSIARTENPCVSKISIESKINIMSSRKSNLISTDKTAKEASIISKLSLQKNSLEPLFLKVDNQMKNEKESRSNDNESSNLLNETKHYGNIKTQKEKAISQSTSKQTKENIPPMKSTSSIPSLKSRVSGIPQMNGLGSRLPVPKSRAALKPK